MTDILLYGHPDSGHACKVALALRLAGIDHETRFVDIWAPPETRDPDFLRLSPFAEVPLLVIDGVAHTQSGAILMEIAARWQVLGGDTPAGIRRGRELVIWEANRIGMCLPQLRYAPQVDFVGYPPQALGWLRARYDVDARNFDRLLGDADFLHGDAPGIGDCAVWGYVQWLDKAGIAPTAAMSRWIARMQALPAMRRPEEFFPH